ncbi:Uncharacterised protein g8778 [Pycnogonum litorale]
MALIWLVNIMTMLIPVTLIASSYLILFGIYRQHGHLSYILAFGMTLTSVITFSPILWRSLSTKSGIYRRILAFLGDLLLLSMISLCSSIYFISWNSLWCCIHDDDINSLCDTAVKVAEILERSNIRYFICYGSILGAYREKGRHIKFEHDVDICIFRDDNLRFVNAMKRSSFEIENAAGNSFFRVFIPGNYYQRSRWNIIQMWVDVYTMCNAGVDKLVQCNFEKPTVARSIIEPIDTNISYCGSLFPKPKNHRRYLEIFYGPSYMTPKYRKRHACQFNALTKC